MSTRIGVSFFVLPFFFVAALNASDRGPDSGVNAFAVASYRELSQGHGNIIFAPFSIATNLSMLLDGARGQTASQIAAVLHRSYPNPGAREAYSKLRAEILQGAKGGPNELLDANALWVQPEIPVISDFSDGLRQFYDATIAKLDLLRSPESARARINQWAEEQTKGKIRELFPAGSLSSDTGLVLTSAVYFHGVWQSPFAEGRTQAAAFKLQGGATAEAPFMNQTAHFGYAENADAQILEMKYAGAPVAFDVLLPRSAGGLPELENSLSAEKLARWFSALSNRPVEVSLPRFRAESEFSLRKALSRMGMPTAFSGSADFSGIDDRRDLSVSDVRQKAFVEVTEQGTTAGAATGTAVSLIAMVRPMRFRADHPFAYVIRDTRSGVILFAGRVVQPGGE